MTRDALPTRAEYVHSRLRAEILAGTFAPGQRLGMVALATRFSVSQSVVREALTRLAEQKMVVALPQQGFRVFPLSKRDLSELTEARVEIESLVLRLAIMRGDVAWESSVLAAHYRLMRVAMPTEAASDAEWHTLHDAYHRSLFLGCRNERLVETALQLRDAAALYRRWSLPIGHDYERDVAGEHRALLDAVIARDVDGALLALRHHIERTNEMLLPAAESDLDAPGEDVAG
jgi:DNA-binding GntR family transcriptional regulator